MKHRLFRRVTSAGTAVCLLLGALTGTAAAQETAAATEGSWQGQPNYVYTVMGGTESVGDVLFSLQWGLYNDGSFTMEEKRNTFPVFDDPFGDPWDRNQWRPVKKKSQDQAATQQTRAVGTAAAETTVISGVQGVDINVKEAWDRFNTQGEETIVALIDTGVDYTNSQLADAIWVNEGEIGADGIDNDGNGYIDDVYGWNFYDNNNQVYTGTEDNHGTHGAGTIGASRDGLGTAGIAGSSSVKLMTIKALGGEDGTGTTESIVKAIRYAEEKGASVCNLSLGTTANDQTLYRAIADSEMLFVVAAGNGTGWTGTGKNNDVTPTYPAAWNLDNLISVANLQPDGTLHYSSNYGARTVDIAAPGSYILSTVAEGGYSYMTGTSMAAPMVTGVAAMLYSQYGDLTAAEARNMILNSAQSMDTLAGKVKTGGMLDAGAALSYDRSLAAQAEEASDSAGTAQPGTNTPPAGEPQSPWWDGTAGDRGTAPIIRITSALVGTQGYLTVNVTDGDGDLKVVRYAEGQRSAAWFSGGSGGSAFSLDGRGNGNFRYDSGGTYTFYAVDKQGNETTATVTLSNPQKSLSDFDSLFRRLMDW